MIHSNTFHPANVHMYNLHRNVLVKIALQLIHLLCIIFHGGSNRQHLRHDRGIHIFEFFKNYVDFIEKSIKLTVDALAETII